MTPPERRRRKAQHISVVIPTLNEAAVIGPCLDRLRREPSDCEVIVVDGGSRDPTVEIARGFDGICVCQAPRGRGVQMNRGAKAASGDILLFLHADCRLPEGGLDMIREALCRGNAVAGSFTLGFDRHHPLLRLYAGFSRINHILFTYGDQGLFTCRRIFMRIGGFREIPLMEDVEIQERLRPAGRFVKILHPMRTSARRFSSRGIVRQQLLNIFLVMLYFSGMPPVRLARCYSEGGFGGVLR